MSVLLYSNKLELINKTIEYFEYWSTLAIGQPTFKNCILEFWSFQYKHSTWRSQLDRLTVKRADWVMALIGLTALPNLGVSCFWMIELSPWDAYQFLTNAQFHCNFARLPIKLEMLTTHNLLLISTIKCLFSFSDYLSTCIRLTWNWNFPVNACLVI